MYRVPYRFNGQSHGASVTHLNESGNATQTLLKQKHPHRQLLTQTLLKQKHPHCQLLTSGNAPSRRNGAPSRRHKEVVQKQQTLRTKKQQHQQ